MEKKKIKYIPCALGDRIIIHGIFSRVVFSKKFLVWRRSERAHTHLEIALATIPADTRLSRITHDPNDAVV